jgi:Mn-containing catalase
MSDLRDLLVNELQDLLNAENQIVGALPKMVAAAHDSKLKETFEKHLSQTETHVERLKTALRNLGEKEESRPCRGMKGILEEGEATIKEGENQDDLGANLALIAAAQKVEHYEICGYGTARTLARQIGEVEIAKTLSRTLGEEEASDFLLTNLTKPIMQQMTSIEVGNGTRAPWGEPGETESNATSDDARHNQSPSSIRTVAKARKAKA